MYVENYVLWNYYSNNILVHDCYRCIDADAIDCFNVDYISEYYIKYTKYKPDEVKMKTLNSTELWQRLLKTRITAGECKWTYKDAFA